VVFNKPMVMLDTILPDAVRDTLDAISVLNGRTGYIDQVASSDLGSAAACTFTDPHHRRGVALRVRVTYGDALIDEGVYTVFERYSQVEEVVVMCRSHTGGGSRATTDESSRYYFDEIVGAHARVTPHGAAVLGELLRQHVYHTSDGHARVVLIDAYS
jgi:hypothetical protein